MGRGRLDLDGQGAHLTTAGRPSPRRAPIALSGALALLALPACAPDPPTAVVAVIVEGCPPGRDVGSGALVGDGLILTTAHTLRGAESITVADGTTAVEATIVAFDPDLDLAYLAADLPGRPLEVDSSELEAGDVGRAWVVRRGETVPVDVTVVRRIELHTEDIYVEGETVRPGLELEGTIEPGDSGGAVVVDGRVVGVVWARSRRADDRAYAIDPDRGGGRISEQLRSADLGDVDLTRC